jgi:cytochrome oxidase Cu insertion factor (SCO1/SenC/PrrC family)
MNILIPSLIALLACCAPALAPAQTAQTAPTLLNLNATGSNGEKFSPDRIRGKVAIVFYWSTSCAVCRDSLPELRTNLNGWRDKPFALVTVNVDKKAEDWLAYEKIQGKTQMPSKGLIAVRQNEGKAVPMKLPLTLLVDAKGMVIARYEGRLAPEAWDGVADLMP